MASPLKHIVKLLFFAVFFSFPLTSLWAVPSKPTHGLALHGDLKHGPDFKHFEYVNPKAPKGGDFVNYSTGTFDSLNPFIIKGDAAAGLSSLHTGLFYVCLTKPNPDEPFSEYGYLAEKIDLAPDRLSITFTLRENATFHDGSPIRPEDVIFSFKTAMEKGSPQYKGYYHDVTHIEKVGPRQVKFTLRNTENRELPLIIGQMPIFSEKYYTQHDFEKASLEIPLGNGPYKITNVEPGRSITYERVQNWWGTDLPVTKGLYNYNEIKYIYFRDTEVAFEGFKSGDYYLRLELSAKNWAKRYTFPAFERKDVIRQSLEIPLYNGMQMLAINTRRDKFKNPHLRHALTIMFDFNWSNKNILYSSYKARPLSYFAGGELAATGKPTPGELEILEPYRDQLPAEVFTEAYTLPETQGDGNIRNLIRMAKKLMKKAGYVIKDGHQVHEKTGKPLEFEILIVDPSSEKLLQGYVKNLSEIGVTATIEQIDSAQYQQRLDTFDFDMVGSFSFQSNSPGNEQREFFSSKAAQQKGSRNLQGVKSPVVDALIEQLIQAETRQDLINHTRALDRVLLWGHYVVPLIRHDYTRIAYWKFMTPPKTFPKYRVDFNAFWIDEPLQAVVLDEESSTQEASESDLFSPKMMALYGMVCFIAAFGWVRLRRRKKPDDASGA